MSVASTWLARVSAAACACLAAATPCTAGCPGTDPFHAFVSPPSTVTQVDSVVTVALAVDSTGTGFNGYTVTIEYDPSVVSFEGVAPGPLMDNPCGSPFEVEKTSAGSITYTCIILCAGVSIDGPGDLALFTFRALALGQSLVQITSNPDCTFFDAGICVGPGHPTCPREVVIDDGSILVTDGVTSTPGAADPTLVPRLSLTPNPTARGGAFTFRLDGSGPARLELFDSSGRRLLHRDLRAGSTGAFRWDGTGADGVRLPSGRYLARLSRGASAVTSPVVVIR